MLTTNVDIRIFRLTPNGIRPRDAARKYDRKKTDWEDCFPHWCRDSQNAVKTDDHKLIETALAMIDGRY